MLLQKFGPGVEERLTKGCQVVSTTHSPFMVQPGNLERVRLVEDRGKEEGARIVEESGEDDLFHKGPFAFVDFPESVRKKILALQRVS